MVRKELDRVKGLLKAKEAALSSSIRQKNEFEIAKNGAERELKRLQNTNASLTKSIEKTETQHDKRNQNIVQVRHSETSVSGVSLVGEQLSIGVEQSTCSSCLNPLSMDWTELNCLSSLTYCVLTVKLSCCRDFGPVAGWPNYKVLFAVTAKKAAH